MKGSVLPISQLSLIIPAYNEEDAIQQTVTGSKEVLAKLVDDFEVIVVDDASADNTATLALEAGARVFKHCSNMGYGNALKTGISRAKFKHVAICDADGTYDLNEFNKLLPYAEDCDMVVGARTGKNFLGKGVKRIARWCQLMLVRFCTGFPVPDANSGMRIFKRENLISYFDGICGGFSFTTSITIALLSSNRAVKFVPIAYHPRIGKSHVKFLRDTLRSMQIIIHSMLRFNPIKAFLFISIFPLGLIALSVICCIVAIYLDLFSWVLLFSFTIILSLLVCVLILGMGMVAYATQHDPNPNSSLVPAKEITSSSK